VSGAKTFAGTFNYTNPAGPYGELTFSNNDTVDVYKPAEVASGSFTFSLNPGNLSGSGSGHGTVTVTTTGFCSGRITVPYTFQIPDVAALGKNITVFFGDPTPANFTSSLTCTAKANPDSTNGNTFPFLSTYPGEFSIPSIPGSVFENLGSGITFGFTITPAS